MRQHLYLGLMAAFLAACAATPPKHGTAFDQISAELAEAAKQNARQPQPETVSNALLPPIRIDIPRNSAKPLEPKFDLVVNNAPATQVFMSLVTDTRYSMLVHPEVGGTISVNLKEVTLFEALNAIRELYGYEYKVEGTRIFIQPLTMQMRVFKVNYLTGQRKGESDIRVSSSSISTSGATTTGTPSGGTTQQAAAAPPRADSSRISTSSGSDFWSELASALNAIVGTQGGRSVVVSPQSGVVMVNAMPNELRNVAAYLRASQLSVERQVILEAKIMEVELNDSYQAGVNWAGIVNRGRGSLVVGNSSGGFSANYGEGKGFQVGGASRTDGTAGSKLDTVNVNPMVSVGAGMFGIAFANQNFASLLEFLQSQGNVQVLSSPRIATLNNQKAVLKVGTDEFFVTNVTSTTTTGTATTTTPSVTLQPFFSGISLDVTPQIDDSGNIILHIHPSVSKVSTVNKQVDLGTSGMLNLPLASSNVSETDSIVRAQDGQIVAIGGLMKISMTEDRGEVPGLGGAPMVGPLFRNTKQAAIKKELVILLKPTVIEGDSSWNLDIQDTQQRIQKMDRGFSYGGRSEVFGVGAESR